MSDLHLTDEQLETLRESHAGLHALVVVWRKCDSAPWEHGEGSCGGFICYHARPADNTGPPYTEIPDDGREPILLGVALEDRTAICLTRNTIELTIAETYWMNQFGIASAWLSEIHSGHSDHDWYLQQHTTTKEKLAAIKAALEKK